MEGGTSHISHGRILGRAYCEQEVGLGDVENALVSYLNLERSWSLNWDCFIQSIILEAAVETLLYWIMINCFLHSILLEIRRIQWMLLTETRCANLLSIRKDWQYFVAVILMRYIWDWIFPSKMLSNNLTSTWLISSNFNLFQSSLSKRKSK